jgi:2-methylisocitrate lyase-like PEP mutase family enzyme
MDTPFSRLHDGPLPLLLPNAWDVPSALAFVADGHTAIGTTSFGVASEGVPRGTPTWLSPVSSCGCPCR